MDCFAGPSFHDGKGSAACEATVKRTKAPINAAPISTGLSAALPMSSTSMIDDFPKSCEDMTDGMTPTPVVAAADRSTRLAAIYLSDGASGA